MNSFNWRLICNVSDTLELSAARFRPFSNTLRCKFPSPRCPNPVTEIVCFCREGDFEAGCVPDVAGSALTSIKSSVGIAWRIKLAVSVTSWYICDTGRERYYLDRKSTRLNSSH